MLGAPLISRHRWIGGLAQSGSRPDTTEVLATVEGHHDRASEDVAAALTDLQELLNRYATPAEMRSGIVDARTPAFLGLDS